MKAKTKKASMNRSNSTKKMTMRNKSHPSHEFGLERLFSQMKSDIFNEMKKVAEIKFNEHKINILKIINKTQSGYVPKKKAAKSIKSEKKEKKQKISPEEDTITYVGTEIIDPKAKEKNKKSKKKVVHNKSVRKNRISLKEDKNTINLTELPKNKSLATEPKLTKKGKIKKNSIGDKNELLGHKRKRGKETFVNLSNDSEHRASPKDQTSKQQKKPSIKKKVK